MNWIAAPFGLLACASMSAAASCATMPADPAICYGGRDIPQKLPDQPAGCHAVLGCAAHRKPRTTS